MNQQQESCGFEIKSKNVSSTSHEYDTLLQQKTNGLSEEKVKLCKKPQQQLQATSRIEHALQQEANNGMGHQTINDVIPSAQNIFYEQQLNGSAPQHLQNYQLCTVKRQQQRVTEQQSCDLTDKGIPGRDSCGTAGAAADSSGGEKSADHGLSTLCSDAAHRNVVITECDIVRHRSDSETEVIGDMCNRCDCNRLNPSYARKMSSELRHSNHIPKIDEHPMFSVKVATKCVSRENLKNIVKNPLDESDWFCNIHGSREGSLATDVLGNGSSLVCKNENLCFIHNTGENLPDIAGESEDVSAYMATNINNVGGSHSEIVGNCRKRFSSNSNTTDTSNLHQTLTDISKAEPKDSIRYNVNQTCNIPRQANCIKCSEIKTGDRSPAQRKTFTSNSQCPGLGSSVTTELKKCEESDTIQLWLQYISEKKTYLLGCMNARAPAHTAYQPTDVEHIANIITHAAWIVPSVLGLWWMTCLSVNKRQQLTALVYGMALFFLFSVSAIYHVLAYSSQFKMMKNVFHIGDRATIYLFIAASYTPWLLLREFNDWEPIILLVVWCAAVLGIIYQYTFHEQYKMLETILYVIIGVCPAIIIVEMEESSGLFELFLGGVAYISGLIFFKADGIIPFAHAIWHIFVFMGASCHFWAICRHLLGSSTTPDA